MAQTLNLQDFVDISKIFLSNFWNADDPLKLLGKNLTLKITELLAQHDVTQAPKILGNVDSRAIIEGPVYIGEGAVVEPTAMITGPAFIAPHAQVRHGAYIRGSVYVAPHAIVGHATEVKGSVFFDHAKAGHFAYVGDSILGIDVNLGAGTKLANLKITRTEVSVRCPHSDEKIPTGLKKMGSIMGDGSQTGCNSVLSPGSLLMPNTVVVPCAHFLGTLRRGIYKDRRA